MSGNIVLKFYLARDQLLAGKAYQLWREGPKSAEEQRARGELSGYPESAIEAWGKFLSGDDKSTGLAAKGWTELPKDILEQDFMAFADFRLSQNWRSEIETPRRWAEEIKKVDAGLYGRIVEQYKNNLHESLGRQA